MKKTGKQIIVIGAGLAGLAAANKLTTEGHKVLVLEARNRIGGRIHTDHSLGVPLDLGASWIHGLENNPIGELARQFDVQYKLTVRDKVLVFDRHHQPFSATTVTHFLKKTDEIFSEMEKLLKKSKIDISVKQAINNFIPPAEKTSDLWNWFINFIGYYAGLESDRLSARYFLQSAIAPDNHLMMNGYSKITQGLAANCAIRLNQIVKKINYQNKKIIVSTQKEIFSADKIIVTLPLGVLKNNLVEFIPILPATKLQALQRLEMGLLNKIILKFPEKFWPDETHNGMYITPRNTPAISLFIFNSFYINDPIITGFTGAELARECEACTDDELIQFTMQNIRHVFGNKIPDPEKFIMTRWTQDPFSCGAYSCVPVGADGSDYDLLAEPIEDRLFFAGEGTSCEFAATTQGAYISGIKAANKIANE